VTLRAPLTGGVCFTRTVAPMCPKRCGAQPGGAEGRKLKAVQENEVHEDKPDPFWCAGPSGDCSIADSTSPPFVYGPFAHTHAAHRHTGPAQAALCGSHRVLCALAVARSRSHVPEEVRCPRGPGVGKAASSGPPDTSRMTLMRRIECDCLETMAHMGPWETAGAAPGQISQPAHSGHC
jgi:hypothetical protein